MSVILINGSHPDYLINLRGPLISDLIARGHVVHVTSPNIRHQESAALSSLGAISHNVNLERRSLNPLADLRYLFDIVSLIKKEKPDFVLGYTIKPNIWGTYAAALCQVDSAVMVTGLGYAFVPTGGTKQRIGKKVIHKLYRLATNKNKAVIFQNTDDRNDFTAQGCLSDIKKAKVVNGSGVDTDYYSPTPLPEKPVFLLVARLLISKGVRDYATAAVSILAKRQDCRFLIAGFLDNGPDSISQEELDSWISSGIEFVGHLDDVRPAISSASVYVLPSYREGTPRTVLEASAMGRAAIVTDVPGCRETIVDGETGYLVPVRDANALEAAMLALANDADLRSKMGAAAREFCDEKYAVGKVNDALIGYLGL
ncbi:glycosyltransferase family 4 protein [Parasphingorhabdus cellanae]|uniref:Glycosyltransferase family 4 protein n=1 Tax=Parasphingorhabdus cellanae TaxID=2806553 RepID=A0ABX7SZX4_9SPHN|nr:glycosyltransferase family 4 protein [Parasphingorhabdus cellanae]QTD54848.1 glycosyltransferase family 4 protein [Parasphingorhabdus cellanae]